MLRFKTKDITGRLSDRSQGTIMILTIKNIDVRFFFSPQDPINK